MNWARRQLGQEILAWQFIIKPNDVIVTPCSVSLAIRKSPNRTGHLIQHWKPLRFKGKHTFN